MKAGAGCVLPSYLAPRMENLMNVTVQIQLPDDLKSAIDRHVATGHARSDADFLLEAARLYAEELDEDQDLLAMAQAEIADAEAGRYTLVETEADAEALHERAMARCGPI